jgi:hypothetical protein
MLIPVHGMASTGHDVVFFFSVLYNLLVKDGNEHVQSLIICERRKRAKTKSLGLS